MKRFLTDVLIGVCAVVIAYATGASDLLALTVGVSAAALTHALTGH